MDTRGANFICVYTRRETSMNLRRLAQCLPQSSQIKLDLTFRFICEIVNRSRMNGTLLPFSRTGLDERDSMLLAQSSLVTDSFTSE